MDSVLVYLESRVAGLAGLPLPPSDHGRAGLEEGLALRVRVQGKGLGKGLV